MKVYDCFLFFNELDLLEIRLAELDRVVDFFVLVEAPFTFQGRPKPLHFAENRLRFEPYLPKIRHLIVPEFPETGDPWVRERASRAFIHRGLTDAEAGDFVLVSDADEIVRPEAIAAARALNEFRFFELELYYFYLDWYAGGWVAACGGPYGALRERGDLTTLRERGGAATEVIRDAGWHFSWMGGAENMLRKFRAFSHIEPGAQRFGTREEIERVFRERHFFGLDRPLTSVGLDRLPVHVQRHSRRYLQLGLLDPSGHDQP